MSTPDVPRLIALLTIIAPAQWRDSLAGDLSEERARRRARGQYAGIPWLVCAALAASTRLRAESFTGRPVMNHRSLLGNTGFAIRQALRTLAARPSFTIVTLLTLTLGIGATTAVFSLANWLIFRPVPGLVSPDELVTVKMAFPKGGFYFISVPEMNEIGRAPSLTAVAAASDQSFHVVLGDSAPIRTGGGAVTSNYFSLLGTRILRGRSFTAAEDDPGLANVAIVSDFFWKNTLGGDPSVIGRRIGLNGTSFEIIGVAEAGFRGPDRSGRTDIWVPLASFRASMPSYPATLMTGRVTLFGSVIARRSPGASIAQIQNELTAIQGSLVAANPKVGKYSSAKLTAQSGPDVPAWQQEGLRQMFALLLTVVGLLLVLTCANVANLLFARAHERAAELATRQALGASRLRIVGQLLFEGLCLSIAGGVLALGVAMLVGSWINGLVIAKNLPALSAVQLDWRVFGFASLLSLVACLASAVLPAVFGSRVNLITSLKANGRGQTSAGRRVRQALTAVQVAVAVTLLATGALLVRSMLARYSVPLGYDADRVLAFSVDASTQGYSEDRTRQFYRDALAALRRLPGVSEAGYGWIEPFRSIGGGLELKRVDDTDKQAVVGDMNSITEGFLPALGARFLDGRDFTSAEAIDAQKDQPGVVILNQTLAQRLFGTTQVAGRQVDNSYDNKRLTIVGVIADIRTRDISDAPVKPSGYTPFGQAFVSGWGTLHVRFEGPASAMIPRVREAMRVVDPLLPLYDIETLSAAVDRHLAEQRLLSNTIAGFAVVATLVAALGLFGLLSRGVAERRREFGIRAALGAAPLSVAGLITREALALSAAGAVTGVGLAVWLSRLLESRLFGVKPFDPASLSMAVGIALAMALVSAAAPARRAASVNVVEELR